MSMRSVQLFQRHFLKNMSASAEIEKTITRHSEAKIIAIQQAPKRSQVSFGLLTAVLFSFVHQVAVAQGMSRGFSKEETESLNRQMRERDANEDKRAQRLKKDQSAAAPSDANKQV